MRSRVPKSELDMLARVPLFANCTQRELREIASLGTELEIPEGVELTKEGATGREFFLVIDGEADCEVNGTTVAVLGPGDFFGELALLDGGPRTATVTAVTPARVIVHNSAEFASLLLASPSIALKLLQNLTTRLRDLQAAAIY
jgi:CRP/FNR family transcriptional regulator, cyclic AMP receptor protein